MKTIELVRNNAELLRLMGQNGIAPSDVGLLPVIDEYEEMKRRGFKVTFAVEYLASKHHISVASLYRAIHRFNTDVAI